MTNRGPMAQAVADALQDAQLLPRDAAAVELVEQYADLIDASVDALPDVGPKLLRALESLGMTPAGRGASKNGGTNGPHRSPLDELRARREQRGA